MVVCGFRRASECDGGEGEVGGEDGLHVIQVEGTEHLVCGETEERMSTVRQHAIDEVTLNQLPALGLVHAI